MWFRFLLSNKLPVSLQHCMPQSEHPIRLHPMSLPPHPVCKSFSFILSNLAHSHLHWGCLNNCYNLYRMFSFQNSCAFTESYENSTKTLLCSVQLRTSYQNVSFWYSQIMQLPWNLQHNVTSRKLKWIHVGLERWLRGKSTDSSSRKPGAGSQYQCLAADNHL
jgi:hypothetical protein